MLDNLSLLYIAPLLNVQLLLDGILIGAIFALVAYGLALVWGVTNVKNLAQGDFVIMGGYIGDLSLLAGSSSVGSHNGIVFTPRTTLGLNPEIATSEAAPRGAATLTPLADGTFLVLGGSGAPDVFTTTVFDDGFIYIP